MAEWESMDVAVTARPEMPSDIKAWFWKWFDQHQEDIILRKKILAFTVKVRVKDGRRFFEAIFGRHP